MTDALNTPPHGGTSIRGAECGAILAFKNFPPTVGGLGLTPIFRPTLWARTVGQNICRLLAPQACDFSREACGAGRQRIGRQRIGRQWIGRQRIGRQRIGRHQIGRQRIGSNESGDDDDKNEEQRIGRIGSGWPGMIR